MSIYLVIFISQGSWLPVIRANIFNPSGLCVIRGCLYSMKTQLAPRIPYFRVLRFGLLAEFFSVLPGACSQASQLCFVNQVDSNPDHQCSLIFFNLSVNFPNKMNLKIRTFQTRYFQTGPPRLALARSAIFDLITKMLIFSMHDQLPWRQKPTGDIRLVVHQSQKLFTLFNKAVLNPLPAVNLNFICKHFLVLFTET